MKPKGKENPDNPEEDEIGLLEYLEELIGSNKFKTQIKKYESSYEEMFG